MVRLSPTVQINRDYARACTRVHRLCYAQFHHGWYWHTVDFTSQVFAPGRWLLFVVPAPHVTPLEVWHCPGIIAGLRCSSMASDTSKLTQLFFYCGTTPQSSTVFQSDILFQPASARRISILTTSGIR